jgi:hypothetical protein
MADPAPLHRRVEHPPLHLLDVERPAGARIPEDGAAGKFGARALAL